jgi:hypothetical protein
LTIFYNNFTAFAAVFGLLPIEQSLCQQEIVVENQIFTVVIVYTSPECVKFSDRAGKRRQE